MGISSGRGISRGLWIFDLNQKTVSRVLEGFCGFPDWSDADTGQIAFDRRYGNMYSEIWTGPAPALGTGQTVAEHVQEAIEFYTQRIEAEPQYAQSYMSRAALYIYLDDAERAFDDLDQYDRLVEDPREKASEYYRLGWHLSFLPQKHQQKVNPGIVVKLHERAHELNPKYPWDQGTLGIAYYRAGRWQDTIYTIEPVGSTEQTKDYYAFFPAMAYWQMGERDQAQAWYNRGISYLNRRAMNPGDTYTFRCSYYIEAAELMGLKVKHFDRKPPATGTQILPITASVDSNHASGIAVRCVDGTGLADGDEDGLLEQSEDPNHMWLNQQGSTECSLEFDLGRMYELDSMLVWNYNERGHTQRGIKQANISVWIAAKGWQKIREDVIFDEAEGSFDYDEPTHIQLNGVKAKKIRLDSLKNFGGDAYIGLSEVQFFERRERDLR